MRADGLQPNLLALNSLINAFGEDRRDVEAYAVLQYMKENVSTLLPLFACLEIISAIFLSDTYDIIILLNLYTGCETRCSYIYHTYESSYPG